MTGRKEFFTCVCVREKTGLPWLVRYLSIHFLSVRFLYSLFFSWNTGSVVDVMRWEQFRFLGGERQLHQVCLKRWEKDTSQSLICNTIDVAIMTPWQYRVMGDSDLWPQPMNTFSLGQRSVIYLWQYYGFWSRRAGHIGHWMGQSLTKQDVVQLLLSFPSVKVFRIRSPLRLLLLYGEKLMGLHRRQFKWCALTLKLNAKGVLNGLTGKC